MRRNIFALIVLLILSSTYMQSAAQTKQGVAVVNLKNNSGIDLVVAMVQGALSGQTVDQVAWLKNDAGSYSWKVPATPTSNANLYPYIFKLKKDATLTIPVPQYSINVGFRCMLSDTAFKHNAMQYRNITAKDSVAYMAFPDLKTAAYIFDKFEAGLNIGFPGIWNITAVDFISLPLQLSSKGVKVGFKDGVTSKGLQKKLSMLGLPYSLGGESTSPNTASNTYRFFSPSHIDSLHLALDTAISKGLPLLNNFKDTVNYGNYKFFDFKCSVNKAKDGKVKGTVNCNYINSAVGVKTATSITVNDVTTKNTFSGEIVGDTNVVANNYNAQVELGAILSAAICRGVTGYPDKWGDIVHAITNCSTPWNYYPAGVQYNQYSKLIHSYSINEKNYGFPYDDFFGDEAGLTAVAGDTVTVTILPIDGKLTAKPNGQSPVKTGSLVATVPASSIYPNSANWQIGPMIVGSNKILAGANVLCSLDSDSVVCTFSKFPQYELHISMSSLDNTKAISFFEKGVKSTTLGITGLYYNATEHILTFGQSASWTGTGK